MVSNGAPLVGLQATNGIGPPQAFFRLQWRGQKLEIH
jgi:hypothetical protein